MERLDFLLSASVCSNVLDQLHIKRASKERCPEIIRFMYLHNVLERILLSSQPYGRVALQVTFVLYNRESHRKL